MIDHVLGRPSEKFRKVQVLAVVSFWSLYLFKGNKHGPPKLRQLSRFFSSILSPWQTVVVTMLYLYIVKNFDSILDLENPEPLANLYTRSYFRATWACTALDAGFWTAMRIKRKWLRDFCSILFSIYYLFAADRADEKVRKVRGALTLDHLRVSWNKGTTPYLKFLNSLMRPRLMKYPPRAIRIPRPPGSDYKEPVQGWLYFDGPLSALKEQQKVVLDIPGGGFVAMDPRTNDDKLFAWAGKTRLPVLSLDYGKAPERPYPYALNECYDVYRTIVASRGRCVGLSGEVMPSIVVTGDSAGGTLAAGTVLQIIAGNMRCENPADQLPGPEGLILIYPGLDFNITNWMSSEHVELFRDRRARKTNKNMLRDKRQQYAHLAGTPHHSDDEDLDTPPDTLDAEPAHRPLMELNNREHHPKLPSSASDKPISSAPTRLAMSSMISYFNDRILSPSMMRSMILLYIGPHQKPDFSEDYYISPVLAPPHLLENFPKTYFLTGERDPLVDDTVIFAGRLTRAKLAAHKKMQERGDGPRKQFDDHDVCEVVLVPGISHGFLQFVGLYPEGWKHIHQCGKWISEIFKKTDEKALNGGVTPYPTTPAYEMSPKFETSEGFHAEREDGKPRHHHRSLTESSGDEGLEMRMTSKSSKAEQDAIRARKEKLLKETMNEASEERVARGKGRGRAMTRKKSLVSLASEDDILGRRMLGLTTGLTGTGEGAEDKH